MEIAGYSGTPLIKKLGIKEDMKVKLIHVPANYYALLQKDITSQLIQGRESPDFVHLFVQSKIEFETEMKVLKKYFPIKPAIIIWVSWYKKSAGRNTGIGENEIRQYALQNGLVDIKICAVDESWSGLKLVIPVAKR